MAGGQGGPGGVLVLLSSALGAASQGRSSQMAQRQTRGDRHAPPHPLHHPPNAGYLHLSLNDSGCPLHGLLAPILVSFMSRTLSLSGEATSPPERLHFPASLAARESHLPALRLMVGWWKLLGVLLPGRPLRGSDSAGKGKGEGAGGGRETLQIRIQV